MSCDLGDDTAILDVSSGQYYGLSAVGTSVWRLIQQPRTLDEVLQALVQQYDVEATRCQNDLVALLEELAAVGLIEVLPQVGQEGEGETAVRGPGPRHEHGAA